MAFWPNAYSSKRTLWTRDQAGRDLVFQSGIAVFDFKGTGAGWRHDELWILTDAVWTGLPPSEAMVALASVSNAGTAVDAGWATDAVGINTYNNRILLQVALAVRDIDGYIHRVSYHVTSVGTLGGWPKV